MTRDIRSTWISELLDDDTELSFDELCRLCDVEAARVRRLVNEGIVLPRGRGPSHWRFRAAHITRVRSALRLHRDLGVNWAGAALALDLLDEVAALRARLRRFEG